MHRLHQDDLTGHLLSKADGIWHHLCLPMISKKKEAIYSLLDCSKILHIRQQGELLSPMIKDKHIKQIKIELGTYAFAAQYQQNPLSECQIKQEWIKRYRDYPSDLSYLLKVGTLQIRKIKILVHALPGLK